MEGGKLERDEELDMLVAEVQRGSEDLHQSLTENQLLREQIQLLQEKLDTIGNGAIYTQLP